MVSIHISEQPSNNVEPLTVRAGRSRFTHPDSHETPHNDHLK